MLPRRKVPEPVTFWDKISVMIATGDNNDLCFFHLIDKPMFSVNPA